MKNVLFNFIAASLLFILFSTQLPACAVENVSLFLNTGHPRILVFDSKIVNVLQEDKKILDFELFSSIFNDKHQLMIKPLTQQDTSLAVETLNNKYVFNIYTDKTDAKSLSIININKEKTIKLTNSEKNSKKYIIKGLEGTEDEGGFFMDSPPDNNADSMFSFDLDIPPGAMKGNL
jgi:hypothetical protein